MSILDDKLKELPDESGVYFLKDKNNVIIYVGKAKSLKKRVSSYFRNGDHDAKTRALVQNTVDLDLILTANEVEALLLERTMIKHHGPKYNVLLTDDKEYPFLRIDYGEDWPRIRKVRRRKNDQASYIGPFGSAGLLNVSLRTVGRVFPLVRCSEHEFRTTKRPCNYFHMKMCLAPCTKEVDQQYYKTIVESAESLLRGENKEIRKKLESEMKKASQAEQYERAANFRDQIYALESISQKQVAVVEEIDEGDAIGLVEKDGALVFHILFVRNHLVTGGETFVLRGGVDTGEDAMVDFLMQYYEQRHLPPILILPFHLKQGHQVKKALMGDEGACEFRYKRKGETKQLVDLAVKNALQYLKEQTLLDDRRRVELEVLKESLKLTQFPRVIECIDISNLQESAIVASNVCFIGGRPAKDRYRKYNVKTVTSGPDDYGSIREVVERRLRRGIEEGDLPDLLVIDGGRGQLSAALDALNLFPGLHLAVAGLAKSRLKKTGRAYSDQQHYSHERVFLPGGGDPIKLLPGSPAFRVLTHIRDEAHRFAISFHRKKRSSEFQKSFLSQIPGVGKVLEKRLLTDFASLDAIREAPLEDLQKVKGVSPKLAASIVEFFSSKKSDT